tara:strand:+ start:157 stop:360 length:204 start_codon:yes stop_codon:yes gene_type:complete
MKKKVEDKAKDALKSIAGGIAGEAIWRFGGKKVAHSLLEKVLPVASKKANELIDKYTDEKDKGKSSK